MRFGDAALRRRLLPRLCRMEHFASYCLTEPDAGSDAASLRPGPCAMAMITCSMVRKAFISGGGVADIYLCMVRTGEAGPRGISCIAVEKGTPGLAFGAQEKKLGWKSQPTAMVMFENCRVPVANLRRSGRATGSRSPWPGLTAAGSISRRARSAARSSAWIAPRLHA